MIYTTLNKICEHRPCRGRWEKLLAHLGKTTADDEPLALSVILESNGLDDTLWCLRSVPEESKRWRRLAVKYARTVQHLIIHQSILDVLDVAERHADGLATDDELAEAREAARTVALGIVEVSASNAARHAARHAANAAARHSTNPEAWNAAWGSAMATSDAAAWKEMSRLFLDCLEGDA